MCCNVVLASTICSKSVPVAQVTIFCLWLTGKTFFLDIYISLIADNSLSQSSEFPGPQIIIWLKAGKKGGESSNNVQVSQFQPK